LVTIESCRSFVYYSDTGPTVDEMRRIQPIWRQRNSCVSALPEIVSSKRSLSLARTSHVAKHCPNHVRVTRPIGGFLLEFGRITEIFG